MKPYISAPMPQTEGKPRRARSQLRVGLAVALASMWLGIIWTASIQPLNAPDEPAYLQAVMETRNKHVIPELHFDFSANPRGVIVGTPGDPAALDYAAQRGMNVGIRLVPYENSQPPLYYLIAGPLSMLFGPDPQVILYVSRLISAAFGAGTVFFCWAATRQLAPQHPMLAVGVAGVIALLPEFCFNNARASNDSLVNCLGAAAFYVWFRGLRQPAYDPWMLRAGAVVGLAVLAKLTGAVLIPGLALVVLFRIFQVGSGKAKWSERALRGARMAVGAVGTMLVVCGWWLVRNLFVYGDITGTKNVNRFYSANLAPFLPTTEQDRYAFMVATWRSFWGYFGWQSLLMPDDYYLQAEFFTRLFLGLTLLAVSGLVLRRVIRWWRFGGPAPARAYAWQSVIVLMVVGGVLVASFVQYNLGVAQSAQGRYMFMPLMPAALLFTAGLYLLAPHRVLKIVALGIPMLWLFAMNMVGVLLVKYRL